MNTTPEISVIIPVYNVERYLDLCVESVLRQTFQDFEIILVDDGSPDNCPALCDEYARKDSRIKVIHKENAGLGMARNSGLDLAVGKYVCFIDSDDFLSLNALEYCYTLAEKEQADQVRFMFRRFTSASIADLRPVAVNNDYSIGTGRESIEPILNAISPMITGMTFKAPSNASSCTSLYRRSTIEKNSIRFLSERKMMSEDFIFNLDYAVACDIIVYTSHDFYNYRHTPVSLSKSMRTDRIERAAEFSKFYAERLKGYGYKDVDSYVMGYTLGEIRSFNKLLFASELNNRQKRELFLKILEIPYVRSIMSDYPVDKMPLMQRVAFRLHANRHFWLSYFTTFMRRFLKDKT